MRSNLITLLLVPTLIVVITVFFLRPYRKGYKQGMFDQWIQTEVLNHIIWNGTGEEDGFPDLDKYIERED